MLHKLRKKHEVVLGSGSPRRKELLEQMGLDFKVETRNTEEHYPTDLSPAETAVFLSRLKAQAFEHTFFSSGKLLITADTIVVLNGKIMGKPTGKGGAVSMLRELSGKYHEVISGIALRTISKEHSFYTVTKVFFKAPSDEEITYYVNHFQPFDKAGAYGIQEWIGHAAVEKIEGSYFNVVGLPTHQLYEELMDFCK